LASRRSLAGQSLYSAFGQSEVSIIYTQLNQYYVVLEVAPPYWQTPKGLKNIYLNTTGSGVIPLSAVARAQANTTPLASITPARFRRSPCRSICHRTCV
jgi:multidrug efflux pump subunit AcrB